MWFVFEWLHDHSQIFKLTIFEIFNCTFVPTHLISTLCTSGQLPFPLPSSSLPLPLPSPSPSPHSLTCRIKHPDVFSLILKHKLRDPMLNYLKELLELDTQVRTYYMYVYVVCTYNIRCYLQYMYTYIHTPSIYDTFGERGQGK